MASQNKKKKNTKPKNAAFDPVTILAKLDRPASKKTAAIMEKELSVYIGGQCSTRMDVAFIAAEMLLHIGRGQMAAQLGHCVSHESNDDLNTLIAEAEIFDTQPWRPRRASSRNCFLAS